MSAAPPGSPGAMGVTVGAVAGSGNHNGGGTGGGAITTTSSVRDGDAEPLLMGGGAHGSGSSHNLWTRSSRALSGAAAVMCPSPPSPSTSSSGTASPSPSSALSSSGGLTWIIKGLCICLGMMLIGGVGSFTLHQMMSPQIESLLRQRNDLQSEVDLLRNQFENITRIAESRMEMIHLLEKELERQALEAAAAANSNHQPDPLRPGPHFGPSGPRGRGFWSTIIYAWTLGSLVLAVVGYRVYRIVLAEREKQQQRVATSAISSSSSSSSSMSSTPSSSMHLFRPSHLIDRDLETGGGGGLLGGEETEGRGQLSPRCYKRAPGGSPTDRLMHI